ncbi:MAG: lactate utilization protein B/C [Sphingobacteriia bacterium]|jgi:L-lactate dehydrogenase complex protein LldG|nr:lactate utilization protein [Paludibacteraceae bacterium]NCA78963.1 lactate utilization protein B/C [Sphingobacteriia bacterium]
MKVKNDSRQQILNKIASLSYSDAPQMDFENINAEIYKPIAGAIEDCFVSEMAAIGSQCYFCNTNEELLKSLGDFIIEKQLSNVYCADEKLVEKLNNPAINAGVKEDMDAAITDCEALVARTGSVIVSAAGKAGRQFNIYPPIHIVIASVKQLFPYLSDAIHALKSKYGEQLPSFISVITGASRTADIEKTLVMGAHGPKEIHVFLLKE